MPTLAQAVKAKYPGVYDDLSDVELEQKVRAKYPGVYDDFELTKAEPEKPRGFEERLRQLNPFPVAGEGEEILGTGRELIREQAGMLPMAGAAIGGLLGATPGMAIGASAGEAGRQAVEKAFGAGPATLGESARGIAKEGAIAGAVGLGGQALGAGFRLIRGTSAPVKAGLGAAGKALYQGKGGISAVLRGGKAALKAVEKAPSKAAVAKVEHAAKQIEKAIAEAPKPQMPKTAARPLAMTPKPAAQKLDLEAAEARIVQLHGDSLSPGQIAEQMRVELAGGAPDVGVKRVRTFVDTVLDKHGIKPHAGYRGTKPNAPPPALSANVGDEFMGQVTAMRRLGVDDTDIAKSLARKYKHYFEGMDDQTAFQMVKMVP